ncbi:hypothetical protein [Anaerosalibacter sp. Marseille-P3206]|uniref:hypothetical protein n=1 Tax=Anaerosalibacter sp. Marseille-P3206 TaxID=1871005 RepID=UPI0009842DA9|nr:hypothetical protein [Anaerosalibacter sp. Marseille-P3206]
MKKFIIPIIIVVVVIIIFATSNNKDKIYSFDEICKIEVNDIDSILFNIDLDNPNNREIEKKDLEKIIEVLDNKRYKVPEGNKITLSENGIDKNVVICKITTLDEKGSTIIYMYNKAISIIEANGKTKLYEIIDGINQEEILMIQNFY